LKLASIMSSLQASYKFALGNPVLPGMVTVGKFDGKHPSLACATVGNRVFVYSPHTVSDSSRIDVRFLNINRVIRALSSGRLGESTNDVLLVGSPTHILAYDVEKNQDIFFKEVSDGITTIGVGLLESICPTPLCFVGGNCSIQGFDQEGEEKFWTVAGDNVRALNICDIDKDGKSEVISGTDDFEIRIVKSDGEVVAESTQTDKVLFLQHIPPNKSKDGGNRIAYALENGTVGLYEVVGGKMKRKWRVKSKHRVCAMCIFDIHQSGSAEIIIGWSNGRIEVTPFIKTMTGSYIHA
jgi:Bardet-Biedl syndrome 2 protein